jgi:hypothetical protein
LNGSKKARRPAEGSLRLELSERVFPDHHRRCPRDPSLTFGKPICVSSPAYFGYSPVQPPIYPPPFTVAQIRHWAATHYRRTGAWPKATSGPIKDTPGETWTAVAVALRQGRRGLPAGFSPTRILKPLMAKWS